MNKPVLTDETYIRSVLKKRPPDAHKGTFGKLLIIAGTTGMAGAAVFSGRAALRAGAGLTRYYVPYELFGILQTSVPEATCIERRPSLDNIVLSEYDAVAVGPGLGRGEAVLMRKLLSEYEGKLVIDADGLNMIAEGDLFDEMKSSSAETVVSPHPGEAARLLGVSTAEIRGESARIDAGKEIALKTGAAVILKGHESLVFCSPKEGTGVYVNRTGTPAMAKGGSGDVLTGIITAFAGQGLSVSDAARAAVFIHGLAGEEAEKETGSYGMLATDMADKIGVVIERFLG